MKKVSSAQYAMLGVASVVTVASLTAGAVAVGQTPGSMPVAAPLIVQTVPTIAPVVAPKRAATVSRPINAAAIIQEASTLTPSGIPTAAMHAYKVAARSRCAMPWQLLAGIGLVESNHGRAHHSMLTTQGISTPPIYGPQLNGGPFAAIRDTDGGRIDGDPVYDRAVGAMQFIPSTWRMVARSATGKTPNPQNINDATLSAAVYLCAGGRNLYNPGSLVAAIFSYNHSNNYVNAVVAVMRAYGAGNLPGPLPPDPTDSPSPSASASATPTTAAKPTTVSASGTKKKPTTSTTSTRTTTNAPAPAPAPKPKPSTAPTPAPSPTPTPTKPPCTNLLGLGC